MKRHMPGVLLSVLPVAVFLVAAAFKMQGGTTRLGAFASEAVFLFWPQALATGAMGYAGQPAGMFATYWLVHPGAVNLVGSVTLLLAVSGLAVRRAGARAVVTVAVAAILLAPLPQAWLDAEPFGGLSGGAMGVAGAAAVWALQQGDRREAALALGLAAVAAAGLWVFGPNLPGLWAGGLAVGTVLGAVLKTKGTAPGGGA
jgi:hypothetical protein